MLKDHDTPVLKRRLLASLGFLMVLMYFSMGHMMWGWPLPAFFEDNHIAMGLVQLLSDRYCHGHQSEVFYQWFYKSCCTVHRIWTRWWHLVQRRLLVTVLMPCLP